MGEKEKTVLPGPGLKTPVRPTAVDEWNSAGRAAVESEAREANLTLVGNMKDGGCGSNVYTCSSSSSII